MIFIFGVLPSKLRMPYVLFKIIVIKVDIISLTHLIARYREASVLSETHSTPKSANKHFLKESSECSFFF